jgi:hypothetical protein
LDRGYNGQDADDFMAELQNTSFDDADHLLLILHLVALLDVGETEIQGSQAAVPFFKRMILDGFPTPEVMHGFVVAAVFLTRSYGFGVLDSMAVANENVKHPLSNEF